MITVATFSVPSDAAEEQSVVSLAQHGEMSHGGAPRDTPVQHGFYDLSFEHPYLSRSGAVDWSYIQSQGIPSET